MKFTQFLFQRFQKYFFYIPITFICISFLIGIAVGRYVFFDVKFWMGFCAIIICLFLKNNYLKLAIIYCLAFCMGMCLMQKQLRVVPANLESFVGHAIIDGYIKDVNYKNSRTNVTAYNIKWEEVDLKYMGLMKLSYKGKINIIQDQKIKTCVDVKIPENFDPEFDYVEYLRNKGIYLIGEGDGLEIIDHKKSLTYYLSRLKEVIITRTRRIYTEPEASLLLGLVTGYRADFDEEFNEKLSKTGTTHIIAISGYNISLLVTLIIGLSKYVGRRTCILLALVVSVLFCILTGACPSIVRATVMAIVVLVGKELGRDTCPSVLLLLTASIMALFNPYILWDIGFQLSFLSTIGLIYLFPVFNLIFNRGYLESLYSTIGAFITTLPVIVGTFGQFSILVFLSNFLVLSVVSFSTILSIINTIFALISVNLGILFSFINYLPLHYIVRVIEFLATFPINIINVNFKISISQIFIYYIILFILILYKDFKISLSENS